MPRASCRSLLGSLGPHRQQSHRTLIKEWAEKEKVEVTIDFITTQGGKLLLTGAAEAQAKSGHDILAFTSWLPSRYAEQLVPVNDIMEPLIKANGAVNATVEYLGKVDGKWLAVPATVGSQIKGPCSRIDLMKQHAGIDVQAMYPAGAPPKADAWTFDTFLKAAEACQKGGHPFGIGVGTTGDNVDTAGAIFNGFGAMLVDAKGNITVKSDPVREALDYYRRLMAFLPSDVPSWDDASNNKFLISGQGALIMNPPSAWAVAKRDAPKVAEQLLDARLCGGAEGPLCAVRAVLLGHLELQQNQAAAKSLIVHLSQADAVEKMVIASGGYDLPSFANFTTFKVWAEAGPPKGTLYHYPNPYNHQILSIAGAPAPGISASRSPSRPSRPRWRYAISRARRWKRRSTGQPRNSKASRATDFPSSRPEREARSGATVLFRRCEVAIEDHLGPWR